ncbi:MAG: hypothetical protein KDC13_06865 [Bacteroidetes bacterium]|nr:hypothetical protein [Bacteroidota bacterium]
MKRLFITFPAGMKKYFFLILIFTFLVQNGIRAQYEGKIQWGGEIFKPSSSTAFSVIGNWKDGVMMQSRTKTKLFSASKTFIQRFDDLTLLPQFNKEVVLETNRGDKSLEYQVMERLGDNPVLFATYYNRQKDKIELYGRVYSIEGEAVGKEKKIAQFPADRKSDMELLQFVPSADSSSMLAFFSQRFDKFSNEKITFEYFSKELESLWEREIEFPYKGSNFSIHRTAVDKNGRVYLLVRIRYDKDEPAGKDGPPFRYSLVTFDGDSTNVEDYELTLGTKIISDIDMFIDSAGNVVCSGFYSNRGVSQAAGTFFLRVNRSDKKIEGKVLNDFDPSFASSFLESSRIKGQVELTDFKMDHLVQFKDGSFGLVAEQFLIDQICYQDFRTGMINCNYFYYYNNIIVIRMDSEGSVIWAADIPKYQESSNDYGYYSSYVFGFDGESMHFVFNDNPKNLTETDQRRAHQMDNVKRATIVHAKLGMDGSFARENALTDKKNRFFFVPSYSAQISDNSIWLVGLTSNKYRVGVLSW